LASELLVAALACAATITAIVLNAAMINFIFPSELPGNLDFRSVAARDPLVADPLAPAATLSPLRLCLRRDADRRKRQQAERD
jgi:hypothetical protein